MDELKPCPYCEKKDTLELTSCVELEECANFESCDAYPFVCVVCNSNKGGCGAAGGYSESAEGAIEKWNCRPAPENKPLTLEQLRQMDGQPVWIDGKDYGGWTIFKASANKQVARCLDNVNLSYYMADYGKTWLAYARKPEVE